MYSFPVFVVGEYTDVYIILNYFGAINAYVIYI